MRSRILTCLLTAAALVGMLAACAPKPTPEPTATPTEISLMEITTATPVTPTSTETSTPTETPTETPTPLPPTDVPTETPTFDPKVTIIPPTAVVTKPQIAANSDSNCRKAPDKDSKVIGFFKKGMTADVIGKHKYGIWVQIDNPTTDYDPNCWVYIGSNQLSGDLNVVPVITDK
jgi:hypothetical protein